MPWFVLYTKSRSEKIVAEKLQSLGVDVYCPVRRTRRKWSDRMKMVEEPLFRSYCFVNLSEQERNRVFAVPGVVRYLFWLHKPAVVRDEEIVAIRRLLNEVDHHQLHVEHMQPGDKVTIESGSFSNLSGKVISQQGRTVYLTLDSLQLVVLKVDLSKTQVSV